MKTIWPDLVQRKLAKMAGDRFHTECGRDVFSINWQAHLYIIWRSVCGAHFNKSNTVEHLSIVSGGTTNKMINARTWHLQESITCDKNLNEQQTIKIILFPLAPTSIINKMLLLYRCASHFLGVHCEGKRLCCMDNASVCPWCITGD
jgi:hypothetical protein